jgi:hypothetical protein
MSERRYTKQGRAKVGIRDRADGKPAIVGYGAMYYDGTPETQYTLWPLVVERIMPGAFDLTIAEDDIRGLFNHDPSMLLGRVAATTMRLSTDNVGLRYEIDPGETQVGRDVTEHVRRGDLSGSSFSFQITDERWYEEGDLEVREILGVKLYDVGPVTFPAYESTSAGLRCESGELVEARAGYEKWKREQAVANARLASIRARSINVA